MDELGIWVAVLRTVDAQFIADVNFMARKWSESLARLFREQEEKLAKHSPHAHHKSEYRSGCQFDHMPASRSGGDL
jgi:hypothetical protein